MGHTSIGTAKPMPSFPGAAPPKKYPQMSFGLLKSRQSFALAVHFETSCRIGEFILSTKLKAKLKRR